MIHLTYSNRSEALLDALVRRLHAQRSHGSPLRAVRVVVPNRNVERYVELGVARRLGVAANLRFLRLAGLVEEWLGEEERPILGDDELRARVLRALLDEELIARPEMAPVRRYLEGAGSDPEAVEPRRAQLALHVAGLFREYSLSRPELLDGWQRDATRFTGTRHDATEKWQASLYRFFREASWNADARTLLEALRDVEEPPPDDTLHIFGLSYVARIFSHLFDALGQQANLFLYALNPCEEFWEDVETDAELRRRRRESSAEPEWLFEDEDPFGLSVDTETPLLRAWGRPGREHVRLLDALTQCDFVPAFIDPVSIDQEAAASEDLPLLARLETPSLLERLQHDTLTRAPQHPTPDEAFTDRSVEILACPSLRREVETVASEIWHLVETLDELSFEQVAVLVNGPDRDAYLPHIEAVFEEAHRIPFNVADLSLASVSPIVEGALRILELPTTRFSRPDVLSVITHPAVRARAPEVDPHEWVALADRLGVFHGLDRRDLAGTYVGEEDRLSWDQGITRVALGAFARSESRGDAHFVDVSGHSYLPEESPTGSRVEALFALLVRSLSSDVRFAREAELSLREWSLFTSAMLRAYLTPSDEREESAMRKALAATESLADLDLDGAKVRYAIALELLRGPLDALAGGRGQHLADGVAVSSLVPMRAIPFRVIFVLGLGEGRFPATDRRDSMDLRAARRQAGDVTPPERDRYTFLETLLCARERLVLSYVARDERTGEALAPSVVVSELLDVIEEGYLPDARGTLVRRVPLRRHEEAALTAVLPEAARERDARRLGDQLREDLGTRMPSRVVPAEAARRVARGAQALERTLRLPPLPALPAPGRSERAQSVRLSLGALRRFLECPLQGWTRTVLRLDEDEVQSAAATGEEPFEPSRLDEISVLRASFVHAVIRDAETLDFESAYARHAAALEARGRWPLGPLARLLSEQHREVLTAWADGWRALDGGNARRVRFGAAATDERGVQARDPIVLTFEEDPRGARGSGGPLRVELVGSTEVLVDEPRASVSLLLRHRGGARGAADELRYGLRAFFDQAALAASGGAPTKHEAVQLYADRVAPVRLEADPLDPNEARAWLGGLVHELLSRTHAYLFPIEAILRLADRFERVDGEALVASVELVRERWGGGQSRFGPVRDAIARLPPPPGEAELFAERRFGPWLRAMRRADGGPR